MWVLYSKTVAITINVILGIFLILFIHNGFEIYNSLHVTDEDAVTGKFSNFAQYSGMHDLDANNVNAISVDRPESQRQNEKVGIIDAYNYTKNNAKDLYEGGNEEELADKQML